LENRCKTQTLITSRLDDHEAENDDVDRFQIKKKISTIKICCHILHNEKDQQLAPDIWERLGTQKGSNDHLCNQSSDSQA